MKKNFFAKLAGLSQKIWRSMRSLFSSTSSTVSSTAEPKLLSKSSEKKKADDDLKHKLPSLSLSVEEVFATVDIAARLKAHQEFVQLLKNKASDKKIAEYALGNVHAFANFCAQKERDQGVRLAEEIALNNPEWTRDVAKLAREIYQMPRGGLLSLLQNHDIDYLKISIASEMAMILRPHLHIVINKRTLWGYFKILQMQNVENQNLNLNLNQNLRQTQSDQNLIEDIVKRYPSWEDWYHSASQTLEKFFQEKLLLRFPQAQYGAFYLEAFWSVLYEEVKASPRPVSLSLEDLIPRRSQRKSSVD